MKQNIRLKLPLMPSGIDGMRSASNDKNGFRREHYADYSERRAQVCALGREYCCEYVIGWNPDRWAEYL